MYCKTDYENVSNSNFKVTNGRPLYSRQIYGEYWLVERYLLLLFELKHECTVIIAKTVLFVAHK